MNIAAYYSKSALLHSLWLICSRLREARATGRRRVIATRLHLHLLLHRHRHRRRRSSATGTPLLMLLRRKRVIPMRVRLQTSRERLRLFVGSRRRRVRRADGWCRRHRDGGLRHGTSNSGRAERVRRR